jgi:hypothetical protein
MMELVSILLCSAIASLIAVGVIAGISINDIRSIKLAKQLRLHPYSRKFRNRPLVSIITDKEPTEECLISIRRSNYKKIEIITDIVLAKGSYILSMSGDTVLERTAISQAVMKLNANPQTALIELVPTIKSPQTLHSFFTFYHQIVTAPFIHVRAGLDSYSTYTPRPIIIRPTGTLPMWRAYTYMSLRLLGKFANLSTLAYCVYIAVALLQPEFLLGYLLAFSLWTVWSLFSSRQLSLSQKITYSLLFPASLGYFVYRCAISPFWPKQYSFIFSLVTRQPLFSRT